MGASGADDGQSRELDLEQRQPEPLVVGGREEEIGLFDRALGVLDREIAVEAYARIAGERVGVRPPARRGR